MQKNGASDGNRTHATSLEGWNSTIELHSQIIISFLPSYNITLKMLCQYLFWIFFIFYTTISYVVFLLSIPQSALLTAPFAQRSLFVNTFLEFFHFLCDKYFIKSYLFALSSFPLHLIRHQRCHLPLQTKGKALCQYLFWNFFIFCTTNILKRSDILPLL